MMTTHGKTLPLQAPKEFAILAPQSTFTRFGFWKPGMQRVHARVWDTLHEMRLRFWSDGSREIKVHPEDFDKARAVFLAVCMQYAGAGTRH